MSAELFYELGPGPVEVDVGPNMAATLDSPVPFETLGDGGAVYCAGRHAVRGHWTINGRGARKVLLRARTVRPGAILTVRQR